MVRILTNSATKILQGTYETLAIEPRVSLLTVALPPADLFLILCAENAHRPEREHGDVELKSQPGRLSTETWPNANNVFYRTVAVRGLAFKIPNWLSLETRGDPKGSFANFEF